MPEEPSRCPACGASVEGDTSFCRDCDSLVSSTTDHVAPSSPTPPSDQAWTDPSDRRPPRVPVMPASTIDCWSCDAPNSPSRMFCVNCGSFIAIGSRTRPTAQSQPFSGPPPVPGDADADVSLPLVEGVSPLGSYSLEAQRRATRRTRTMTAVASVVLAMVVGAAALYLASPLGGRGGDVPQTAIVAATDAPRPTEQTRAVSGVSIQPEAAPSEALGTEAEAQARSEPGATEPEVEAEADPVPESAPEALEPEAVQPGAAEPGTGVRPEAVEPASTVEPATDPGIESEPMPASESDAEAAVERASESDAETANASRAVEVGPAESMVVEEPTPYDGGWVCGEDIVIEDSGDRNWSISHASFRVRGDFERVILHLDNVGQGSGDPTTITADSIRSRNVRTNVPAARAPGLGRRSVTLLLEDGFSGMRGLNAYRPSGVGVIKEFSLYPVGSEGRSVVISADTDGCYRVRVPGWSDPSGSLRRAEIHVDIKP